MQDQTTRSRPIDEEEVAALLAIYLSQQAPASADGRKAAVRHLIEVALFEFGGGIPAVELGQCVGETAGMSHALATGILAEPLRQELDSGRIDQRDGRYILSEERTTAITEAQTAFRDDEVHFCGHLRSEIERELGRPPAALAEPLIVQAVETVIVESARHCQLDAEKLADQYMAEGQPGPLFDPLQRLAGELTVVSDNFELGSLSSLIRGVRKYFGSIDAPCQRHIRSLFQKVFCHQLLNLDPALHEHQKAALEATRVYLDTNVAVDFLLDQAASVSSASREVISASRQVGIQLHVSPATLQELERLRDNADAT